MRRPRTRAAQTRDGLVLTYVGTGSIKFVPELSGRIDKLLRSRPVAYVGALTMLLGLLGLEPHLHFGDDDPPPVASTTTVQNTPVFVIQITVNNEKTEIRCTPHLPSLNDDKR